MFKNCINNCPTRPPKSSQNGTTSPQQIQKHPTKTMSPNDRKYRNVISDLEKWGSYENSSKLSSRGLDIAENSSNNELPRK